MSSMKLHVSIFSSLSVLEYALYMLKGFAVLNVVVPVAVVLLIVVAPEVVKTLTYKRDKYNITV